MSGDLPGKRDAKGIEHLTREALLAFICEQCSELEQNRIQEHLLTGCEPCNRLYAEMEQGTHTLHSLKHMSRYLYYPELQSNQVLLHIKRGESLTSAWTGKRKRKFQKQPVPVRRLQAAGRPARKTGLGFVSIPAAFALFILFVLLVATLVYALVKLNGMPLQNGWPINIYHPDWGQGFTSFVKHQTTPTPAVRVTVSPSPAITVSPIDTPTVSSTVSPSPTLATTIINGAELNVCLQSQYNGPIIAICGQGFKGVDRVWLEIEYSGSNTVRTVGPFPVTSTGQVRMLLFIYCKYSPLTVFAVDKMHQPLSPPLTGISSPGCFSPTPTPTVTPGSK